MESLSKVLTFFYIAVIILPMLPQLITKDDSVSEQLSQVKSMKDILMSGEIILPKIGDITSGEIISISKNYILIDLGALGTGIVYPKEFYESTSAHKELKAGMTVSSVLLDIENEDGFRELSLKQAQMTSAWQDIKDKRDKGEVITTKIININKGGLIVEINGIQGFLPLSQLGPEHYPKVDGGDTSKIVQVLQKYRNQDFQVKILDFSEAENRLIVSEKIILNDKLKEEIAKFKVGDIVEGEVTDITDFGAFVKITDGLDGLVHISEIDWKMIDNPRDILGVGQKIKAKIATIEGSKVSLSIKALKPDPWLDIEKKYQVGQVVEGKVVKITSYGVLVRLEEDLIGLILNTEFGDKKAEEAVEIEKTYPMAIVSISPAEHKLLLTLERNSQKQEEK